MNLLSFKFPSGVLEIFNLDHVRKVEYRKGFVSFVYADGTCAFIEDDMADKLIEHLKSMSVQFGE